MSGPLFFGCWNEPGHYLYGPDKAFVPRRTVEYYGGGQVHIDGTLAPRKTRPRSRTWERFGDAVVWQGMGETKEIRDRIQYDSAEYPQGQFLRHELDVGWSAIQWWDRCQGDSRGACNSTILLEGRHTSEELLEALATRFPHVLANLKKAGVALVEIHL